jgi:hypothetical protein
VVDHLEGATVGEYSFIFLFSVLFNEAVGGCVT